MFNFFSKNKKQAEATTDFSHVKVDMHSHLLPGIDDGSPDLNTSLRLIKGMAALGYQKLITTPHIMWDMYKNTPAIIQAKLDEVKQALASDGVGIEIEAAAEYFLDEHVEQLLKNNEPLLTVHGNMVLTEFSLAFPSHSLKDILFDMQMQGYQPIIAHPERYIYLEQAKDFYDELKDLGCLFQLNLLSLTHHYGRSVHELAGFLMKKGYYDLVGTDLHHARHLESLRSPQVHVQLQKLLETGRIRNSQL